MAMRLSVTYKPYATSSKEKIGDIVTFSHFEKGNLLSETCEDVESGDNTMTIQLHQHYLAEKKWM